VTIPLDEGENDMWKKVGRMFRLCIFLLCLVGCTPQPGDSDRKLSWTSSSINELEHISQRRESAEYFSSSHLLAMIGEPELKVKASELLTLLLNDANHAEACEGEMEQLFLSYRVALERRSEEVGLEDEAWRGSAHFNNLDVWLYQYRDPPEVIIGGVFPRGHGVFATTCFLVDKNKVIASGVLSRSFAQN